MIPPAPWVQTMHLPQIPTSASSSSTSRSETKTPPQTTTSSPSPSPPNNVNDPDAPLNLSKPKGGSGGGGNSSNSSSTNTSPHNYSMQHAEQPVVAATTPKLLPPTLIMGGRPTFLPYAGLPPHLGQLPPSVDRRPSLLGQGQGGGSGNSSGGSGSGNVKQEASPSPNDNHGHFPMHMYGIPPGQPHLPTQGKSHRDDASSTSKEEADFMTACGRK